MRKALVLLMMLIVIVGCSKKTDSLIKAQEKINNTGIHFNLPTFPNYSISYIHILHPPRDKSGQNMGSKVEVLVTYTDQLGALEEVDLRGSDHEREIVYGPYKGETIIEVTLTNTMVGMEGSEQIKLNDQLIHVAQPDKDTRVYLYNSEKNALTMTVDANQITDEEAKDYFRRIISEG
ncbi:hypothetical protein NYE70_02095 [Paenibacillus sp. FSL R5-0407]|uniref:hypothetical protein n=1 Tax=Paenibacillus sp. FSL R5-0407 TaxID=2975320 RepID=UPI0030FB4168